MDSIIKMFINAFVLPAYQMAEFLSKFLSKFVYSVQIVGNLNLKQKIQNNLEQLGTSLFV